MLQPQSQEATCTIRPSFRIHKYSKTVRLSNLARYKSKAEGERERERDLEIMQCQLVCFLKFDPRNFPCRTEIHRVLYTTIESPLQRHYIFLNLKSPSNAPSYKDLQKLVPIA